MVSGGPLHLFASLTSSVTLADLLAVSTSGLPHRRCSTLTSTVSSLSLHLARTLVALLPLSSPQREQQRTPINRVLEKNMTELIARGCSASLTRIDTDGKYHPGVSLKLCDSLIKQNYAKIINTLYGDSTYARPKAIPVTKFTFNGKDELASKGSLERLSRNELFLYVDQWSWDVRVSYFSDQL